MNNNHQSDQQYDKDGHYTAHRAVVRSPAVTNDAWYCIALHSIALYCMVVHGIAWYCMVLHGIA